VTGARGGVGATTIAVNLAWYLADEARRHTALFDPDLQGGTAAMMLGLSGNAGLRTMLENPDRADDLLVERTAQSSGERLHVLAGEEGVTEIPTLAAGAGQRLMSLLQRRYNYIVVDLPFRPTALSRELLNLAHQRVIVADPSLSSMRDALRLLALPAGPAQAARPILLLNRAGCRGGLSAAHVKQALELDPDLSVPDLPQQVAAGAVTGKPVASQRGAFRNAIMALAREAAAVGQAPQSRGWRALFRRKG